MSKIEVIPAKGISSFLTFCKIPRLLYAGEHGFAPSLDAERWTLYGHALNPHFKLVDAQEFLARRNGRWVGRIAAQVYKPEITPVGASRWQFGSLDAIDDLEVHSLGQLDGHDLVLDRQTFAALCRTHIHFDVPVLTPAT